MKFMVTFSTKAWSRSINIDGKQIGLEGVDLIRQETGVKELSLEKMCGSISTVCWNPDMTIPEKVARDSGHYQSTNQFTVFTKPSFLNQFCEKVVKVESSQKSGKIKSSQIKWKLNEEKVISGWVEAGYPEYWECEKPNS